MPAIVVDQATGVTSVDVAVSAGLSVSGGPITASGTITVTLDADLQAIAGLTSAADKGIYFTGSGTASTHDLTSFARTILDDTDAAAVRSTIGAGVGSVTSVGLTAGTGIGISGGPITGSGSITVSVADAELLAIAGLTSAANKGIVFTGSGTASTFDLSPFALTFLDDADAAAVRTTLGAGTGNGTVTSVGITAGTGIGVSGSPVTGSGSMTVSITDAELLAIAGLTSAANKGITFTGAGTAATYDLSAFALTILDDADAGAVRTTIGAAPTAGSSSIVTVGALTSGSTGAGFTVALATATITGTLGATNGGTGNAFTAFTGPASSIKTFTLPNASATILTSDSVAQGEIFYGSGPGVVSRLAVGTSGKTLTTLGASNNVAWLWNHQQNRLYNTSAAIWQRQPGTESTDTSYADDTYSADGYNVLTQTGNIQCSRQTGSTRSRYCYRMKQQQASAQRMGFCMILEAQDCIDLRMQTVSFQGILKCSSSQAIRWAAIEWTGTADAPVSDPVNDWTSSTYTTGNFFKSTTTTISGVGSGTPTAATWTEFSLPVTVSSACNNLMVMVWTEGTAAQNVTLDVAELGLYLEGVGKLWVPPSIGDELRRCQRYFWRFLGANSNIIYGWRQSTNVIRGSLVLPVDMRAAATLGGSSPSWSASDPSTNNQIAFFNPTAGYRTISGALSNISNVGTKFVEFIYTAGTSFGGSSGEVGFIQLGTAAYIDFLAEL